MADAAESTAKPKLRNGEFYAEGAKIFRAPVWTANDGGGNSVSMGFHACTASEWCEASNIVECLNASRHHDALVKALEKVRSYNSDIAAGRINYRPEDHIQIIDEALAGAA